MFKTPSLRIIFYVFPLFTLAACGPASTSPGYRAVFFDGSYKLLTTNCLSTPDRLSIDLGIIAELPDVNLYETGRASLNSTGVLSIHGDSGCVAVWQRD